MAGDKNKLTEKQRQILEYLKQEILQRGFPPSVREICEAVSLRSTSSVHAHLETLERKGYIKRDATKPRAIEICDEGFHTGRLGAIQGIASEDTASQSEVAQIPLIGKVAAGEPILAVENIEGYFPMPVDRLPNAETFLLKVQGESMVNAGILDGDLVLVEQQATAENGEKIVALVNDSATVKTFYKEDGYFRLQPENDEMDPILVNDLQIVGKVIGVLRFLLPNFSAASAQRHRPAHESNMHMTFGSFFSICRKKIRNLPKFPWIRCPLMCLTRSLHLILRNTQNI